MPLKNVVMLIVVIVILSVVVPTEDIFQTFL